MIASGAAGGDSSSPGGGDSRLRFEEFGEDSASLCGDSSDI